MPEYIVRNKRDNQFYKGTSPAGAAGITKQTLHFLQSYLNPLAFRLQGMRPKPPMEGGGGMFVMKFGEDMFREDHYFRHSADFP